MIYIGVAAAVFVFMLSAPFAGAIFYCAKREGMVLHIDQSRIRDARYFGRSFANLVEENLSSAGKVTIRLSRVEPYLDGDEDTTNREKVDEVVICRKQDYQVPEAVRMYRKEIYAAHNLRIQWERVMLRAAYAKESVYLGKESMVDRWVDAEHSLIAKEDCDLGLSASAGEMLQIGAGCRFKRLYAPVIRIGERSDWQKRVELAASLTWPKDNANLHVRKNIRYVSVEDTDEQHVAPLTVVTSHNLTVLETIIVQGDIRSHKGVRLCDHALVCGNIFAEKDVLIGAGTVVLGNVFTQGNIVVERDAIIGQLGQIHSVVARGNIVLEEGVTIYGFVSCEGGGCVRGRMQQKEVTG